MSFYPLDGVVEMEAYRPYITGLFGEVVPADKRTAEQLRGQCRLDQAVEG